MQFYARFRDEVIAEPATITGSIGVIAMFPGFDKAFHDLGLRTGGYTTPWLAGAFDNLIGSAGLVAAGGKADQLIKLERLAGS